jgi:uncharacterized protein (DUF2235 family)
MKHLVYLIDGTWVFAGELRGENRYSNVYQLSDLIGFRDGDGNSQIIHYIRGLGATKGLRKYSSGGFGYAINENIQDIYLNICANYEPGDKLYIFGFSRGAVVARAVCGLIDFGVLKPNRAEYLPDVWNCFIYSALHGQSLEIPNRLLEDYKLSRHAIADRVQEDAPEVSFLGLFDTVLGGRNMTRALQELNILPGTVPKCVKVAVALHALDETRPFFEPQTLFSRGSELTSLEQIWLPGVHTDIGGGYPNSALSDISLIVMLDRLAHYCHLNFDADVLEDRVFGRDPMKVKINDEYQLNGFWSLRGLRRRRAIPETLNDVHPIADDLVTSNIVYKGKDDRYRRPDIASINRCDALISNRYRNRRFAL